MVSTKREIRENQFLFGGKNGIVDQRFEACFKNTLDDQEGLRRLSAFLECGITPVVYGDIVYHPFNGCKIISTEQVLLSLWQEMKEQGKYRLEKVIFCTNKDGVEDEDGHILPFIDKKSFHQWEIFRQKTMGYDVTGGMEEKVKTAMKFDAPVQIISGKTEGNLLKALKGDSVRGTVVGEGLDSFGKQPKPHQ